MRCGMIAYATEQGLGHLAKDFYDNGVVQEVLIFKHPGGRPTHQEWYPGAAVLVRRPFAGPHLEEFLQKIDVLMAFETPFDWEMVNKCKERGIATALMPMCEWHPINPPAQFDKFLCPSLLDLDYFPPKQFDSQFIPVPVSDKIPWQQRTKARRFLHNAGHVGSRNHKGTDLVLKAVPFIKSDAIITVRGQDQQTMGRLLKDFPNAASRINIEVGSIPYEQLWNGHDVLLQPERYNGLSLPLQEARAAGMLVMASDRYPANTWLPKEPLISVQSYQAVRAAPGHLEIDEAVIEPQVIAAKVDEWFDKDITDYSLDGKLYAEENSWQNLKPVYMRSLEKLVERVKRRKQDGK